MMKHCGSMPIGNADSAKRQIRCCHHVTQQNARVIEMLKQRIITALVLLAILLPAVFYHKVEAFAGVALVLISAATWEWAEDVADDRIIGRFQRFQRPPSARAVGGRWCS